MNLPFKSVLLFSAMLLGACSSNSPEAINKQPDLNQKISTKQALQSFSVEQRFWRSVRKTKSDGKRIISLVHSKENPTAPISTDLMAYGVDGNVSVLQNLPEGYSVVDFDITPDGSLIQIAFSEVEVTDQDFGFALKELTVFENSKKLFVFNDSKLNQAIQYAADGSRSLSKPFDPKRTLFLTSSPLTAFARIRATNDRIYVSAYGTFGFKVFEFDKTGQEISQAEILPKSSFNTVLVDEDAPFIELGDGVLYAAITTSVEDAPIIEKQFGIDLDWQGPRYQVVVQAFGDKLAREKLTLAKGSDNFAVSGLAASSKSVAVFGDSGGAGNRKALAVIYSDIVLAPVTSEFSIEGETSLYSATFLGNQLYVAGSTGSSQVNTGSVVVPSDAFVSAVDVETGASRVLSKFGTERHDRITSIFALNNKLYVSGNANGPITHTSDTDLNLGYQEWFLGELR